MPCRLAAHADWSVSPAKRWLCFAERDGDGWRLGAPGRVGDAATLLARLNERAEGRPVVLGVDFPIGLPRAYAARLSGLANFPAFLDSLAERPAFFQVAARIADVSPERPFYPARGIAGMTRAAHAAALGLDGPEARSRACDRATAYRPAGAPIFWTLGANQTGKAALHAWSTLLLPARRGSFGLWPFAGNLRDLLVPGQVVLAETYPAEALRQLGLSPPRSKRRQADRAELALPLRRCLDRLAVRASDALAEAIDDGFGADAAGEDRFDSLLGVLNVIAVVSGRRPDTVPDDPWIRRWEGWVLGQTDLPKPRPGERGSGRHAYSENGPDQPG